MGCGHRVTMGHGEVAVCGQPFYGDAAWECDGCKIKRLTAEVAALVHDNAELLKIARDEATKTIPRAALVGALEPHGWAIDRHPNGVIGYTLEDIIAALQVCGVEVKDE